MPKPLIIKDFFENNNNLRATLYPQPDGSFIQGNVRVFNGLVLDPETDPFEYDFDRGRPEGGGENCRTSAIRAKEHLFGLVMSNPELDMFVTLTFDPRKVDRYDVKQCSRKMDVWLSNNVQRRGLKYAGTPELHKDGAIHYHLLCNESGLELQSSGHKRKGKTVYNVQSYPWGFSTAIRVSKGDNDRCACAGYLCKYITKQILELGGARITGRYMIHGGKLREPVYYDARVDYDALPDRICEATVSVGRDGAALEMKLVKTLDTLGMLTQSEHAALYAPSAGADEG